MSTDKEDIKREVIQFFEDEIGKSINDETRIFSDVGFDGFDAFLIMQRFSERFNIDMSEFDSTKYFANEKDLLN